MWKVPLSVDSTLERFKIAIESVFLNRVMGPDPSEELKWIVVSSDITGQCNIVCDVDFLLHEIRT